MAGTTTRALVVAASDSTSDLIDVDALPGDTRLLIERADSAAAVEEALQWFEPDFIVSEYELPGLRGLEVLRRAQKLRPETPLIFVLESRDEPRELEALRAGATDCVLREDRVHLLSAVRHALTEAAEHRALREAERALKESESRFRLFMENMPGAAYMKDLEGRFTYINSVAERVIGRRSEEIIGKTLHQLYPSDVADALAANDQRALLVRQPVEALEETGTSEGKRLFLSVKFPVLDADGMPVMVGGFSVDVTTARAGTVQG